MLNIIKLSHNTFIIFDIFISFFICKSKHLNKILPADLAFTFYFCSVGCIANVTNGYYTVVIHFLFCFYYLLANNFTGKISFGNNRT